MSSWYFCLTCFGVYRNPYRFCNSVAKWFQCLTVHIVLRLVVWYFFVPHLSTCLLDSFQFWNSTFLCLNCYQNCWHPSNNTQFISKQINARIIYNYVSVGKKFHQLKLLTVLGKTDTTRKSRTSHAKSLWKKCTQ